MKAVTGTKTQCAIVCAFLFLAFVSQAAAVFRPLFPIKPAAPSNGEVVIIGDELVVRLEKKPLLRDQSQGH